MKYNQIEAFYQVMLTGSITKAAKALGRTQPAISFTISTLEEQFATRLFDRHAGRIVPRAEARVLFEQISPVVQQLNDIRERFGRLVSVAVPRISIISCNNAGMHLVPSAVSGVVSEGQDLRLMTGSTEAIVSEMQNQKHDLAVTDEGRVAVPTDSLLMDTEIFSIPTYVVFPAGMPLADNTHIMTQDLSGLPICTLYEENRAVQEIRARLDVPRVEFSAFFPMACFAAFSKTVAIVDKITWTAIQKLTAGTLQLDARAICDAPPNYYYLLRPRFRFKSAMADRCYGAVRQLLTDHQM